MLTETLRVFPKELNPWNTFCYDTFFLFVEFAKNVEFTCLIEMMICP